MCSTRAPCASSGEHRPRYLRPAAPCHRAVVPGVSRDLSHTPADLVCAPVWGCVVWRPARGPGELALTQVVRSPLAERADRAAAGPASVPADVSGEPSVVLGPGGPAAPGLLNGGGTGKELIAAGATGGLATEGRSAAGVLGGLGEALRCHVPSVARPDGCGYRLNG